MIVERSISLSAGEWRIMERLWDRHPQTLTELVRALGADTGWSKSTIVTMVGRLEAKGAVTRTEGGRARLYAPAVPRERAALEETESLLHRVYRGSVGMMVNTLADGRGLTDQDIEELSAVLERARRERK
jgi:BlaI family penicillinase repressor